MMWTKHLPTRLAVSQHIRGVVVVATMTFYSLSLSSCMTLPSGAPLARDIINADTSAELSKGSPDDHFRIIPIHDTNFNTFPQQTPLQFAPLFTSQHEIEFDTIKPADHLNVTIFDAGGGGLIGADTTGVLNVTGVEVERNGLITLPYLGKINTNGYTPNQLSDLIVSRLRKTLSVPQVVLTVQNRASLRVTLQGDVLKPGVYEINRGTRRLTDLLSLGGLSNQLPNQYRIEVRRGEQTGVGSMWSILNNPQQDIALQIGDRVIVTRKPEYFTVLGATNIQGRVEITSPLFTLADAIGSSRGLADDLADIRNIFLFRPTNTTQQSVIYHIDLRDPKEIFLTQRLNMLPGDILVVTNAPFTQVKKLLSAVTSSLGTTRSFGVTP